MSHSLFSTRYLPVFDTIDVSNLAVMSMKKIIVKLSNERLITPSGLTLVGGALGKSDLVKRANRMVIEKKRSQSQIKNGDILLTYIGLLCQGKTSFDSVREFHADPDYFKAALGISYGIPSSETLRQRMDSIGRTLRNDILNPEPIRALTDMLL